MNDIRLEAGQKYLRHEAMINIERKGTKEVQRMETRLEAQLDRALDSNRSGK
jgi:hypothetical protein